MTNSSVEELTEVFIKTPLQMAKLERENLVPVVGAGVSLPLGLPNWQQFIANLAEQAHFEAGDTHHEPPDLLEEIKQRMGETAFTAAVQHQLSLPSNSTTTALQALVALVNAPISKIITTNLDFAIETAFSKAQKPLNPANVARGYATEELALFDRYTTDPILLKIHGSIERPSTWVLTRKDYDAAYVEPGYLKIFLSSRIPIPLFVGFSFSDFDVNESLRLAKLSQMKRAYTIIQIERARNLAAKFKALGVIPIGFYSYDQIPEIIDEIFDCSSLSIRIESSYSKASPSKLRVGGAEVQISSTMKNDENKLENLVSILANAFELQPNRSIITEQRRREYGQKGTYRDDVIRVLMDKETDLLKILFKGFIQYPEILFDDLTNSILRKEEVEQFYFFRVFFDCFSKDYEAWRMEQVILSNLHNPELGYRCLRDMAKIAAIRDKHPALRIPPNTVTIGRLIVPVYLLTRYQVGVLMGRNLSEIEHPLWPYTIHSLEEADEIIKSLNRQTNQRWRLPSAQEWLSIAGVSASNPWPWGKDDPQYKVHAHLKYLTQGGNVANHPLEVGIFPRGKSPTGLFDLVGNTYELVIGDNRWYHLAGGAWTTSFKSGSNFSLIRGWSKGKDNIGIRPVCTV